MSETTPCYIYRSSKKEELYLFLPEKDKFDEVPPEVMKGFGIPEFAMELLLSEEKRLARSDASEVLANLANQGFHLQVPPTNPVVDQQIRQMLDN